MNANFKTVIRNISGVDKTAGFLPKSKRVLAGAELEIEGDLIAQLSVLNDKRKLASFGLALEQGVFALVNTTAAHVYDATLDVTKVLSVDNGSVVGVDPAWGGYSSSV